MAAILGNLLLGEVSVALAVGRDEAMLSEPADGEAAGNGTSNAAVGGSLSEGGKGNPVGCYVTMNEKNRRYPDVRRTAHCKATASTYQRGYLLRSAAYRFSPQCSMSRVPELPRSAKKFRSRQQDYDTAARSTQLIRQ